MTKTNKKPLLVVRNAKISDVESISKLCREVYPEFPPYTSAMLRGQINSFPEGQFVVEYEKEIVGYCATFICSERLALKPHTWTEITGNGYASQHNPNGQVLYGMEVFVSPKKRGLRIGQRLYNARKKLCKDLKLKGIVYGGRIPDYGHRAHEFKSPRDYINKVQKKKVQDQVLSFQIKNHFEVIGLLENYLPSDKDSKGFAAHLIWRNPSLEKKDNKKKSQSIARESNHVRVGTVQYLQRRVKSFKEFAQIVEYFVDVVADYKGDFVIFPELFPLQLLSIEKKTLNHAESIVALTKYEARIKELLHQLAISYNINIIGGSLPVKRANGKILNVAPICLRDGSIHEQTKIHPTPNEVYWWNIEGGDEVNVIQTDCGPIGVLICYDSEFPELARHLIDQGAKMLFVPFCTDTRQSYLRVRYCCQARAVENQCYVIMSGNVGNLPGVENMDIQYAQSAILTPCDFPFARDGVAADTTPNTEMVAFADLRMNLLTEARNTGSVQNLKDRRFDLYQVNWKG